MRSRPQAQQQLTLDLDRAAQIRLIKNLQLADRRILPRLKRLLRAIDNHARSNATCRVKIETLCAETGDSRSTVKRSLTDAWRICDREGRSLIQVTQGSRYQVATYAINWNLLVALSAVDVDGSPKMAREALFNDAKSRPKRWVTKTRQMGHPALSVGSSCALSRVILTPPPSRVTRGSIDQSEKALNCGSQMGHPDPQKRKTIKTGEDSEERPLKGRSPSHENGGAGGSSKSAQECLARGLKISDLEAEFGPALDELPEVDRWALLSSDQAATQAANLLGIAAPLIRGALLMRLWSQAGSQAERFELAELEVS